MMKKYVALNEFETRIANESMEFKQIPSKKELKDTIREIADTNESFENTVFELGCSVLAKAYIKARD